MNDSERCEQDGVIEAPKPKRKRGKQKALRAGSGKRGLGSIFRSSYIDRKTGKRVEAETFSISYSNSGQQVREYGFASEQIARDMLELRLKD